MASDPVDVAAKAVRAVRYAERGEAVGPKVSEEDRLIAADWLEALRADGWRIVRFAESYEEFPVPMFDPDGDPVLSEEWTG